VQSEYTITRSTKTIQALWGLEKIILESLDFNEVSQKICDALLHRLGYLKLGYKIIVLTLVDEKEQVLKRVALSQTAEARKAQRASAVPFHQIDIPLDAHDNLLIKTIREKKPHVTHSWPELFAPILTPEQATKNQIASGIKTSLIYPIMVRREAIGAVIFSLDKQEDEVADEEAELITGFSDIIGLAVQNAKLYTSLGETTKQLKSANHKLQQLDKLKDEFVSIASHELRTPMVSIKNYLWMALAGKGGKLTEKQEFYLQRAYDSSNRMTKLINDMLNISRIESGRILLHVTELNLPELIDRIIDENQARAKQVGVKLHREKTTRRRGSTKETELSTVLADQDKVAEVLVNLIGNALKFTPKSGTVSVRVEADDEYAYVSVIDDGVGLEKEQIPKLFKKFGMVKDSYRSYAEAAQGSGLGLYVSKSIIELHEGDIWVTSEGRDKGSTFCFTLRLFSESDAKRINKRFEQGKDAGIIASVHTNGD